MGIKRVVILHGYAGNLKHHWQNWLAAECKSHKLEVHYPVLPDADHPKLEDWLTSIKAIPIDRETAIVCHSLGCALALQYLRHKEFTQPVGHLILVAPLSKPSSGLEHLAPFYVGITPEVLTNIKSKLQRIDIVCSDHDEYADLTEVASMAESLAAKMHIIAGGGHLGNSYKSELPEILRIMGLE